MIGFYLYHTSFYIWYNCCHEIYLILLVCNNLLLLILKQRFLICLIILSLAASFPFLNLKIFSKESLIVVSSFSLSSLKRFLTPLIMLSAILLSYSIPNWFIFMNYEKNYKCFVKDKNLLQFLKKSLRILSLGSFRWFQVILRT